MKSKISIPRMELKFYQLIRSVKYAFQRMKKGYSDGDVSDMDEWFLRIVPKMLGELKKNANSNPELFSAEIFVGRHENDFDFLKDNENLSEAERNIVLNEWLKTIDRLIELFEKAGRHSHLCYCCEEAKRRRQYLDEAFMLFSKYFNDFWL